MQIVVLAGQREKRELLLNCVPDGNDIRWIDALSDFGNYLEADAWIDLLFENAVEEHTRFLKFAKPRLLIIGSVIHTLESINLKAVRINSWPGFLNGKLTDAAGAASLQAGAEKVMKVFGCHLQWVNDSAGLVTPRVISMIINEAFLSLEEGVGDREAIDTAMKLGTNYPHGPFEWANIIGVQQVAKLLCKIAENDSNYRPAANLQAEAGVTCH